MASKVIQSEMSWPGLKDMDKNILVLAGLAQQLERRPADQSVPGSIWVRAPYLHCGSIPGPGWGRVRGNQSLCPSHVDVSFCLLPPTLPENQLKNILG